MTRFRGEICSTPHQREGIRVISAPKESWRTFAPKRSEIDLKRKPHLLPGLQEPAAGASRGFPDMETQNSASEDDLCPLSSFQWEAANRLQVTGQPEVHDRNLMVHFQILPVKSDFLALPTSDQRTRPALGRPLGGLPHGHCSTRSGRVTRLKEETFERLSKGRSLVLQWFCN